MSQSFYSWMCVYNVFPFSLFIPAKSKLWILRRSSIQLMDISFSHCVLALGMIAYHLKNQISQSNVYTPLTLFDYDLTDWLTNISNHLQIAIVWYKTRVFFFVHLFICVRKNTNKKEYRFYFILFSVFVQYIDVVPFHSACTPII